MDSSGVANSGEAARGIDFANRAADDVSNAGGSVISPFCNMFVSRDHTGTRESQQSHLIQVIRSLAFLTLPFSDTWCMVLG